MKLLQLSRPAIVHLALVAFAAMLVLRSAQLQIFNHGTLSLKAAKSYYRMDTVPAPRGEILDIEGRPLARSTERLSLAVAPNEVLDTNRAALRKALSRVGISGDLVRKATGTRSKSRWVSLPRNYMPSDLAGLRNFRGVYTDVALTRESFAPPGVRSYLGRVNPQGQAEGGLERILDSTLTGDPGLIRLARHPSGKWQNDVQIAQLRPRTAGNSVTLTINKVLQGISEDALRNAVAEQNALGGDIVIVDPRTGEIRAIASYSAQHGFASTDVISAPFEPGSTLKPLLTTRLLELGRARPDEIMETGRELIIPGRRTPVTDDHPQPFFTLHDVIKHSSNIGMIKFSDRLSVREQYETFRDFGLGIQTGVTLPGEAAGRIAPPDRWTAVTKSSSAIGYEISVTSLQLAMAFAAIANGGTLLEPTIIQQVQSPDGATHFRHSPREVRRVMSPATAAQMRSMLRDVVEGGTAVSANISIGQLAGKTGTARRSSGSEGYKPGQYNATFAGMFPAADPEFVIVVRIVDPKEMYGGATAAPVTAAVLKAAAAAQDAALDRRLLIDVTDEAQRERDRVNAVETEESEENAVVADVDDEAPLRETVIPVRVVDLRSPEQVSRKQTDLPRAVPYVDGMPLRAAVNALHRAGFKVKIRTANDVAQSGTTMPVAGSSRSAGETVVLFLRQ